MPNPLDTQAQRQVFLDAHITFKFSDTPVGLSPANVEKTIVAPATAIGYPLREGGHHPRGPRLAFDDMARFE